MTMTQQQSEQGQQFTESNNPGRRSTDRQRGGQDNVFQTTWDQMNQQGAYVELGTGDLYRVPQEALITGASPVIQKVSRGRSRLLHISDNPYVPILHARNVAASNNIQPNF